MCLLLAGCASGASVQAPTFPTMLQVAYNLVDTGYIAGNRAFVSNLITAPQAVKVLTAVDSVKANVDAANQIYQAGNAVLATSQLNAATGQLSIIQSCMNAANAKLTIDACLGQGGAP